MAELPSGTVTFLFTDIEGSTRLLQELGDGYADALAKHRRLLRDAFTRHGGVEVDTQGDAFFVAFARATDAVAAAEAAQLALAGGPVRVRAGIHTGQPRVTDEGYVGLDVHAGARIAAVGHGGQVLLSKATRDVLDSSVEVRDLGEHRLKDLAEPVWIFQLGGEDFPPVRSLSNTNLPVPASSFVGRERELEEAATLLTETRLLTVVGAGGTGKTRFAIELAAGRPEDYPNGVFWVPLAPLRDPSLVLDTAAQLLGAKVELAEHIANRRMLILFDNFEHVVEAGPPLSDLLSACPNLTLLVTSRELLRIQGETEYALAPLASGEAVDLFCTRARVEPCGAVVELCRRLEGLPLAIELAAARARLLSPEQLLERLSERLDLLKGGRDADPRHATLRATITWSHDLLTEEEQRVFAAFSVFAGGCTLQAAEDVCESDLDTLQSLLDKSLVRKGDGRFWMLETIREYASEELQTSTEADAVACRHAHYYLSLAERADSELRGPRQADVAAGLGSEDDNFRAALEWSITTRNTEVALGLGVALGDFWYDTDRFNEGRGWLDRALVLPGTVSLATRGKALRASGNLAKHAGDYRAAFRLIEESLAIFRELGDPAEVATGLRLLGMAASGLGEHAEGIKFLNEALRIYEELGDTSGRARTLHLLGERVRDEGDYRRGRKLLEESLALSRELGDSLFAAATTHSLGDLALDERQLDRAKRLYQESLSISARLGRKWHSACCLAGLAAVAALNGDAEDAKIFWSAVESTEEELGSRLFWFERSRYEEALAELAGGATRGPDRELVFEQVVEWALFDVDRSR